MTVAATLRSWAARLEAAAVAARDRNALRTELADLAALGELDRTLADVGLTRAQLDSVIESHPSACRLLTGMLDRLGLDPARIDAVEPMREVAWRCTICAEKQRCGEWLAADRSTGWQAFCPNVEVFEAARDAVR
jgi:uncharacterized protein YjiS (DUF1127 family)